MAFLTCHNIPRLASRTFTSHSSCRRLRNPPVARQTSNTSAPYHVEPSSPPLAVTQTSLSNLLSAEHVPEDDERAPKHTSLLNYLWPRFLLLGVAAIWGTNFATVKLLQSGPDAVPMPTAAFLRFSVASLSLAPFAIREAREYLRSSIQLPVDFLKRALVVGAVLTAGYSTQSVSLLTTDANKTAFICSLAVVAVPLLQRIPIFPSAKQDASQIVTWGAPMLAVLGVAMLELGGDASVTQGDVWAVVQAVSFGAGFLLNERIVGLYPRLAITASWIQLSVVALLTTVWATTDVSLAHQAFQWPDVSVAHGVALPAVLYAGVVTTALTVWLSNVALRKVSASELAVLLSTEPMWAAAFSAALLGEHMGSQAVLGGCFILAACVLNQVKDVRVDERLCKGFMPQVGALLTALSMFITSNPDV